MAWVGIVRTRDLCNPCASLIRRLYMYIFSLRTLLSVAVDLELVVFFFVTLTINSIILHKYVVHQFASVGAQHCPPELRLFNGSSST